MTRQGALTPVNSTISDTKRNGAHDAGLFEARNYQDEMFRESMKRNIICAMDTGSGKTAIAVLRIREELDANVNGKRVWFLCPTVALAEQQACVMRRDIPAASTRVLCGKDGVDAWKSQQHWDRALEGFDIIVTTHAVLKDALGHGFVKLQSISLLVFDEAHHAANKHPAMRIMDVYHDPQSQNISRPKILGLTASPVVRKGQADTALSQLERNLDAVVRTPKLHREQLLQFVHRPIMSTVIHDGCQEAFTHLYDQLQAIFLNVKLEDDPYIKTLKLQNQDQYIKAVRKGKSYTQDNMKKLVRTAKDVHDELGPFLSYIYIREIATRLCERSDHADAMMPDMSAEEKTHVAELLRPLAAQSSKPPEMRHSLKLQSLIELLEQEIRSDTRCILFVKTRADVWLLNKLLEDHAPTLRKVKIGTLVGTSSSSNRGNNIELLDPRQQQSSLGDLASGEKNLLICTSVAEEGIDIAACNLVVCFEPPPNLKSFVQRRGRARMSKSKYIMFLPRSQQGSLAQWQDLEHKMMEAYMDEMRELDRLKALEEDEVADLVFRNEDTGARLTLDDAMAHLYHFCNKLPGSSLSGPVFELQSHGPQDQCVYSCEVHLPASVDTSLRSCSSKRLWRTQRRAKEEAAFQTLESLFEAGLLNGRFLPSPVMSVETDDLYERIAKRPNFATVAAQRNPWRDAAELWATTEPKYQYKLLLSSAEHRFNITVLSALRLDDIPAFSLYPDSSTVYTVELLGEKAVLLEEAYINVCNHVTRLLLSSIFSGRMSPDKSGFPLLFSPTDVPALQSWLADMSGTVPGTAISASCPNPGIVRDWSDYGKRYTFEALAETSLEGNPAEKPEVRLKCRRLGKRADMLHPWPPQQVVPQDEAAFLDPLTCTVDRLPLEYAQFARMIPSIMHRIETQMIATKLCRTILHSVELSSPSLTLPAISTPVAREGTDYERLELLGDTVLKVLTSITLMTEQPNWHEGYLSHWKDRVVSNGRLATAAEQMGLTPSILTRPFTGAKWRPQYNEDILESDATRNNPETGRELSTKTLADVCEALIGVSYLDGHFEKALRLLRAMIPEINWQPVKERAATLRTTAATHLVSPNVQLQQLESLLEHRFSHKSLLVEAITHASHISTSSIRSYDRLEFLGDALLDYMVCTRLFRSEKILSVPRMHRLKTAAVNSGFLAYCALSTGASVKINDITTIETKDDVTGKRTSHTTFTEAKRNVSLPDFLRFTPDHGFSTSRRTTMERFQALEPQLRQALSLESSTYPWTLLAAFDPDKTYSDMIESVLGAVWIDTGGDFDACEKLARRLGILDWLDDAIARDVHVWHPKEEIGAVVGKMCAGSVTYDVSINEEYEAGTDMNRSKAAGPTVLVGEGRVDCKLLVGDRVVVETSGWNRIEAETRAAELAIKVLGAEVGSSRPEVVSDTSSNTLNTILGEMHQSIHEDESETADVVMSSDADMSDADMPDASLKLHSLSAKIDSIATAAASEVRTNALPKRKFNTE